MRLIDLLGLTAEQVSQIVVEASCDGRVESPQCGLHNLRPR
jgi:hypothetical protein